MGKIVKGNIEEKKTPGKENSEGKNQGIQLE